VGGGWGCGDGDKPAGETPPAPTPPPAPAEPAKPDKQQEAKAKLALAARRAGGANAPVPDNAPKPAEIDARNAVHVASVHRYDAGQKTMLPVAGAGGLSVARNEFEAKIAAAWALNIWADTLA